MADACRPFHDVPQGESCIRKAKEKNEVGWSRSIDDVASLHGSSARRVNKRWTFREIVKCHTQEGKADTPFPLKTSSMKYDHVHHPHGPRTANRICTNKKKKRTEETWQGFLGVGTWHNKSTTRHVLWCFPVRRSLVPERTTAFFFIRSKSRRSFHPICILDWNDEIIEHECCAVCTGVRKQTFLLV